MRAIFILTFVANVVVTLISLAVLPPRVAIHFGADGMANGWAPNYVNALLMTGTYVLLFCSLYFGHRLARVFPLKWTNLPNKEYWLSPANKARTMEKIQALILQFGVVVFIFLLIVGLLTIQANLTKPVRLNLRVFFPAMGAILVYIIWWTIMYYRAFRIPGQSNNANHQMHDTAYRRP
ncbi:MAG: DUF1648 domain-containing protein [Verrucomicrobia bacterium]|nr:DUF1648 domain-containing protein [Verrucomicrobiota bacterium]MBU1735927.1 DUF1648 domain-containing protein [Verrucomicrobiota bacterium]MBU1857163.1 DUF1648 domain-containing protein [Verrucomicrobiota bacterium]